MNRTLFVDNRSKHKINALRMEEYSKAQGFEVDLLTLAWKPSDDESYVMALEAEGKIIATMRGEIITDQALLEKKLECPWNFPLELKFPILLLSRAATDSSYRGKGLNLIQRYWFLKLAEELKIPFVLGTFVKGSPRENTLREMGYEFFTNELGWQQSTYRSLRPVNVVALNMKEKGMSAIEYCRTHSAVEEFPLLQNFPAYKGVTVL